RIENARYRVRGAAWFDHEWSSRLLDDAAMQWDWMGINLDDGGAVAAGQIKDKSGREHWAAGTWRVSPTGPVRAFGPDEIEWAPLRHWRSPRTDIVYPRSEEHTSELQSREN